MKKIFIITTLLLAILNNVNNVSASEHNFLAFKTIKANEAIQQSKNDVNTLGEAKNNEISNNNEEKDIININNENNDLSSYNIVTLESLNLIYDKYINYTYSKAEALDLLLEKQIIINSNIVEYNGKTDEVSISLFEYYTKLNKYINILKEKIEKESMLREALKSKIKEKVSYKIKKILRKQNDLVLKKVIIFLDYKLKEIRKKEIKTESDIKKIIKIEIINDFIKEILKEKEQM